MIKNNNTLAKTIETQAKFLGINNYSYRNNRILFTKKDLVDIETIKQLFRQHEYIGFMQVNATVGKIKKLYQVAEGKIDKIEFDKAKRAYSNIVNNEKDRQISEVDLKEFPLVTPIVNSIVNDFSKKYTTHTVRAINPEAINEIIEKRNEVMRDEVVKSATALFELSVTELDDAGKQQKREAFKNSPKIKAIYSSDYRLEQEIWANHILNIDKERLHIPFLEKELLRKKIITDRPYVAVLYDGYNYTMELVDERSSFCLYSPLAKDASEYDMFGWFTYLALSDAIGKYQLTPDQAEVLQGWVKSINTNTYMDNRVGDPNQGSQALTDNHAIQYLQTQKYNSDVNYNDFAHNQLANEIPINLVRETQIHFKIAVKRGELTYIEGGKKITAVVDEDYKVNGKAEYDLSMTTNKTAENLATGEHIDWFWTIETWTGIKLDVSSRNINSSFVGDYGSTSSIWVKLERDSIQIKDPYKRFSSILPIHGRRSSIMTDNPSIVEKVEVYQDIYSFLGNRIRSLASTEIGSFLIFNQNQIPTTGAWNEEWGSNNFKEWAQLAHDMGVTLADNSLNPVSGQQQIGGQYGQVVDLTKDKEIINKLSVMVRIKEDMYSMLGLSPQQLGEISPYQTASSVMQGLQRSSNMIEHLYTETKETMRRALQTCLCYAKQMVSEGTNELTYTSSDGARQIFKTDNKDITLSDYAIYVVTDLEDVEKLHMISQSMITDTGSTVEEKLGVILSKTSTEALKNIKQLSADKLQREQDQRDHDLQKQKDFLQSQKETQQLQFDHEKEMEQMRDAARLEQARQTSLGYANGTTQDVYDATLKLKQTEQIDRDHELAVQQLANKKEKDTADTALKQQSQANDAKYSKTAIELLRLKEQDKAIDASKERTKVLARK